jgi:hypothetical protein
MHEPVAQVGAPSLDEQHAEIRNGIDPEHLPEGGRELAVRQDPVQIRLFLDPLVIQHARRQPAEAE